MTWISRLGTVNDDASLVVVSVQNKRSRGTLYINSLSKAGPPYDIPSPIKHIVYRNERDHPVPHQKKNFWLVKEAAALASAINNHFGAVSKAKSIIVKRLRTMLYLLEGEMISD
jgi:hypothetical protein